MIETVEMLPPMHSGEVLREEFLLPLRLSAGGLAKAAGVPRTRIERIATDKMRITADTALRLGRVLGTSAEFWTNLQARFDLRTAQAALADEIQVLKPLLPRAA